MTGDQPAGRHRVAIEQAVRAVQGLREKFVVFQNDIAEAAQLANEALGEAQIESAVNVHQAIWALTTNTLTVVDGKLRIWESELNRYREGF